VRLLLDTHVVVWALDDDHRLGRTARRAIENVANAVYVSVATVWEMALKSALGKLDVPSDIGGWIERSAFSPLPIEIDHAVASAALPRHHRDPFDRMLVAQAQLEGLTLVTGDSRIARYDVATLDAYSA
jgi:PIN domain nuclease of toxin-antitoxin system